MLQHVQNHYEPDNLKEEAPEIEINYTLLNFSARGQKKYQLVSL